MANLDSNKRFLLNKKMNQVATKVGLGDLLHAADSVYTFTSSAGAGGAASAALTVTGLLATDTILSVTQKTAGANSLPLLGYTTLANNALTVQWSADPGAGAVIVVTVKRV